jgi:predicted Zn-dependent protease
VLHALTGAGVFEPAGEQAAAWADAPKPRARFVVRAILLTLLLVCGIAGGVYHLLRKRQAGLYEAADLCRQAESMLFTSLPSDLAAIDAKLSRAFDLSPRDPAAALLWARARTLRIFLLDPKSDGLDTAVARARAVGVREDRIAFARIASYLREDDTESALALVAQWDIRAQNDPYFQLVAGAALERAGDARAAERYRLASSLTPDLVVARVLLARAVLLEIDVSRGLGLATEIQKRWPDRAESAALLALAWARDPNRGPPPPETRAAEARKKDLPPILRAVPLIDTALEAIQNRAIPQARSALTSALAAAGAPSLTSFIGALALRIGDEELARLAASEVERVCPLYPPGRVLTARVALTAGRYDEAEKSTLDLDPTAPEVAMVRAILGFERASPGSLSAATSTVPADLRLLPELYAMTLASSVLRGVPLDRPSLLRLASPENPWGDLVAIDAALDAGDLALAAELLDRTRDAKTRPPHALRVARLLRYQGKAKEADAPGQLAVQALGTPPAIIERMFVLLALDRIDEARALIGKSSAQLGPMAPWLAGYVDSDGPLAREARKKLATLDTPSNEAPFVFRRAVAIVLSHVADRKRAIPLIRSLAQLAPKNPDVLFASQSLP